MRVDAFDFDLPQDRIALRPVSPRDASKMLVVSESLQDRIFRDLADILQPGDVLVFNDTKVLPTQLAGTRERDGAVAKVSATLHTRTSSSQWKAFVKGAKKLKVGDRIGFGEHGELQCSVERIERNGDIHLAFDLSGADFDAALMSVGTMPLPPYIASARGADDNDMADYQTLYAREEGAVAAPTAGLHFTESLIEKLEARGIGLEFVTLHVGPGTFLPVKVDDTDDHDMHSEWGEVSKKTADRLNQMRGENGRTVCVGTTSMRLLESAAQEDGEIKPWSGFTDIFITPGYRFKAVDALVTNFHLPRSTLFMLVSAFSGINRMKNAYAHAIANDYRFYSYGDASLLFRAEHSE